MFRCTDTHLFLNKIALTRTHKPLLEKVINICVCYARCLKQIIKLSKDTEKYRNSLTRLKEFHNNICIVFKHSYFLKYWSYDILSMRKRIFSIFVYTCPLFFLIYLAEKSRISGKTLKIPNKSEIWKCQSFFEKKSENLKNLEDFEKQKLKI